MLQPPDIFHHQMDIPNFVRTHTVRAQENTHAGHILPALPLEVAIFKKNLRGRSILPGKILDASATAGHHIHFGYLKQGGRHLASTT